MRIVRCAVVASVAFGIGFFIGVVKMTQWSMAASGFRDFDEFWERLTLIGENQIEYRDIESSDE